MFIVLRNIPFKAKNSREENSRDRLKSLFSNYKIGEFGFRLIIRDLCKFLIGKTRENRRSAMFAFPTDNDNRRFDAEVGEQTIENWNQF